MIIVTHKATGEKLEVFDFARDDYVFAGPPGEPAKGRMIHRTELDPDPFFIILDEGFVAWHDK